MATSKKFSVLLVTRNDKPIEALCRLIKRHFTRFYTAATVDEASQLIKEKEISVLILGMDTVQESEVFYLHLIRTHREVENDIAYTLVLCDKTEVQKAFSICNKDIFDDYFIAKPLYDPYHILLQLRSMRRALAGNQPRSRGEFSVDALCDYFDQVTNSSKEIQNLNQQSFERLIASVSNSIEHMKQQIWQHEQLAPSTASGAQVGSIIDSHAKAVLLPEMEEQSIRSRQALNEITQDLQQSTEQQQHTVQRHEIRSAQNQVGIMVVEDDKESLENISTILTREGFKVFTATTATRCLKQVDEWQPRIALVDLTLPDMSAMHVISSIRSNPLLKSTQVVALAGKGDRQHVAEIVKMGVHEVMIKPVDQELLLYKVYYLLRHKSDSQAASPE